MKNPRTFRVGRLFHQLMKPLSIPIDRLDLLVERLSVSGFIQTFPGESPENPIDGVLRYSETVKMTSKQNRSELFKIVRGLKETP